MPLSSRSLGLAEVLGRIVVWMCRFMFCFFFIKFGRFIAIISGILATPFSPFPLQLLLMHYGGALDDVRQVPWALFVFLHSFPIFQTG